MKYNIESVEYAVETILPSIKQAKELGADFHLPNLMKDAAEQYLLRDEVLSLTEIACFNVIKEGLKELYSKGIIEYGDVDIIQEIKVAGLD